MPTDRLTRILTQLSARDQRGSGTKQLCELATDITATSGAGIMLLWDELAQGSLCSTDPVSSEIEELQYTLGEGPSIDAHSSGKVTAETNLAGPETSRWEVFTPSAIDAGVRALFSYPVRIGAVRLGTLNLFRDRPGPLTGDQHADALVMADICARAILTMQADARTGRVAVELEEGTNFHFVVHQAAGMASVQLDVSVTEALIRIRAYAFRSDRPIDDVSLDVITRNLRLNDPDDG
jgi:GAF domain-containing protein